MSVSTSPERIVLHGRCGVEEAEPLLAALTEAPGRPVVIEAERLHTALWQILIALRPVVVGTPKDTFVMQHIMPLLLSTPDTKERSEI